MTDHRPSPPPYDANSRRKSNTLILFVFGLTAFAAIAFGALHVFGRNFGVPV